LVINNNADCEFDVDRDALKVVFNNLTDNAIKYSTNPVKINVDISCNSQKLRVEFSDNGIGIQSKELKNVFNKFYRIYNRDVPSVKGTGLGLYLVKEIIKSHGGNIIVTSEGSGNGSTFIITLPVYQPDKRSIANKLLKKSGTKKENINDG
ncbi:MAG: HAMP domain-containing sensor histidine kinase, partial [Ignavibacteria bacterium]